MIHYTCHNSNTVYNWFGDKYSDNWYHLPQAYRVAWLIEWLSNYIWGLIVGDLEPAVGRVTYSTSEVLSWVNWNLPSVESLTVHLRSHRGWPGTCRQKSHLHLRSHRGWLGTCRRKCTWRPLASGGGGLCAVSKIPAKHSHRFGTKRYSLSNFNIFIKSL